MYEFLEYRVKHVMTREPITIEPQTPLEEAQLIFEEHDFDALPVLDREGQLVGVLAKLDLCRAFGFSPESKIPPYDEILAQPAERVMTRSPVEVDPETRLTRVLQLMIDTRYKSLPVVEKGRLIGVIAREDVLRAVRSAGEGQLPRGEGAE
jgi:CBS domain-containing protein